MKPFQFAALHRRSDPPPTHEKENPMKVRLVRVALIVSAAVVLTACASKKIDLNESTRSTVAAAPAPVVPAAPAIPPAASTAGTPQSQVATVNLAQQGAQAGGAGAAGAAGAAAAASLVAPAQRIVFFDFDSFALRDEFTPMLEGHARVLAANPTRRMMVEGHTDERGGREYNLALGQKRAEAVLRSLVLLGASEGQLEAVSFGKERPAVEGSNEAAWAQNRRAELKDR
jgi:peptidoglycan-associated lipoprotein